MARRRFRRIDCAGTLAGFFRTRGTALARVVSDEVYLAWGAMKDNAGESQASVPDEYTALVEDAVGGDPAAIERLLVRAQEVARRFSLSVCGHAGDAEDAMQEALIKTHRYMRQIRSPGAFRPWLYRTVRNACLMSRRKRVHEPARLESLAPIHFDAASPDRNPEQLADNARLRRRLQKALRTLPAPYRVVVFLREMEGLSTREVAVVMKISEDNVKARLSRARSALQVELTRSGKAPGSATACAPARSRARTS